MAEPKLDESVFDRTLNALLPVRRTPYVQRDIIAQPGPRVLDFSKPAAPETEGQIAQGIQLARDDRLRRLITQTRLLEAEKRREQEAQQAFESGSNVEVVGGREMLRVISPKTSDTDEQRAWKKMIRQRQQNALVLDVYGDEGAEEPFLAVPTGGGLPAAQGGYNLSGFSEDMKAYADPGTHFEPPNPEAQREYDILSRMWDQLRRRAKPKTSNQ